MDLPHHRESNVLLVSLDHKRFLSRHFVATATVRTNHRYEFEETRIVRACWEGNSARDLTLVLRSHHEDASIQ
jgi:hypothetical protein